MSEYSDGEAERLVEAKSATVKSWQDSTELDAIRGARSENQRTLKIENFKHVE